MQVNILERDITTGIATIQFVHNDVTHTDRYDLQKVVPGTDLVLKGLNLEFTAEMQATIIQKLADKIQREIESGILRNPI
jgi:hypothetical protein